MASRALGILGRRLILGLPRSVSDSTIFLPRRLLVGLEQALLYILWLLHLARLAPLDGLLILGILLSR